MDFHIRANNGSPWSMIIFFSLFSFLSPVLSLSLYSLFLFFAKMKLT